jgi:integrase
MIFALAALTIEGELAKSGKTRHIPLNKEALHTLQSWYQQCSTHSNLVFSNKLGNSLKNTKKTWMGLLKNAGIQNFRWHDMRHHFASRLVMAEVDLNTVRELLDHSDIKMTLRYAHLAPEHKAQAVEKLIS